MKAQEATPPEMPLIHSLFQTFTMRVVAGIVKDQFSRVLVSAGCWEFVEEITPTPLEVENKLLVASMG